MACNLEVLSDLPTNVRDFVWDKVMMFQPDRIHVCDGSIEECKELISILEGRGAIKRLSAYNNNWIVRTDPADVARVESRTFISTPQKHDTVPRARPGVKGTLGNWIAPEHLQYEITKRFPGCMRGRTMYVIPFSMGPVGGPISKVGIEITDSEYVALSMRTMTRMGRRVMDLLRIDDSNFIKAIHSVGLPKPEKRPVINGWPCNPEETIITHIPEKNEIWSYGSGYGGNSLLGKKCFALRLGSKLGQKEGWLAEHMLILGLKTPEGKQFYVAAAFPSACGKTNLAMLEPSLPGYKVTCVGDDIAWMKFDKNGVLRAINPEYGFFGVAPGTSMNTNPNAMRCLQQNCVFTNVAETSDGRFFWEGLEDEVDISKVKITDWKNQPWSKSSGTKAAHPNSRFTAPASQCPIIDDAWESPEGVPISAIIFGGRRPEGIPLVYESFNWQHGVFIGAAMKSESTAAAEHRAKVMMHDPFAMRPFFGYNAAHYMEHWLSFESKPGLQLPKIFHVNWFRKNSAGEFMWPGFGENIRVLDWILRRVEGKVGASDCAIGRIPNFADLNMTGMPSVDMQALFHVPKEFLVEETKELEQYFDSQLGPDMPKAIAQELHDLIKRIK